MKIKNEKKFQKIVTWSLLACVALPFIVLLVTLLTADKAEYKINPVTIDENYDRQFQGVEAKMANSYTGETYSADLEYRVNTADNTACVGQGSTSDTAIIIPTYYSDGTTTYTVTAVDYSAFANNTSITSVTFKTPANITLIDAQAFAACTALTTFNSSTTGTFVIPASITAVNPDTFYGCLAMTALAFQGNQVTSIGSNAFAYCYALASTVRFKIGTTLTVGDSAFANDIALPS